MSSIVGGGLILLGLLMIWNGLKIIERYRTMKLIQALDEAKWNGWETWKASGETCQNILKDCHNPVRNKGDVCDGCRKS
jgi:hypothetical protein